LFIVLILFLLVFGCTSPDTFIINNVKVSKIIDVNDFNGVSGQIPFFNLDGNKFTIQDGFDFNSDTNTLNTKNVSTNIIWNDTNHDYGTIYCTDGNIIHGYLGDGFTC